VLRQIKALQNGEPPDQPREPGRYFIRSLALNASRAVPWQDLMQEHMLLKTGVPGGAA
jgi:hypothetical protein